MNFDFYGFFWKIISFKEEFNWSYDSYSYLFSEEINLLEGLNSCHIFEDNVLLNLLFKVCPTYFALANSENFKIFYGGFPYLKKK